MSNFAIQTYLLANQSEGYIEFNGDCWECINSITERYLFVTITDEGFQIAHRDEWDEATDEMMWRPLLTLKQLKAELASLYEEVAPVAPEVKPEPIITNIDGEFQLLDIASFGVEIEPSPVTEAVEQAARNGGFIKTSIVPTVRMKWNPDCSQTSVVVTNPEAIAFAKAVRSLNPRVEMVSAYVLAK